MSSLVTIFLSNKKNKVNTHVNYNTHVYLFILVVLPFMKL